MRRHFEEKCGKCQCCEPLLHLIQQVDSQARCSAAYRTRACCVRLDYQGSVYQLSNCLTKSSLHRVNEQFGGCYIDNAPTRSTVLHLQSAAARQFDRYEFQRSASSWTWFISRHAARGTYRPIEWLYQRSLGLFAVRQHGAFLSYVARWIIPSMPSDVDT